MNCLRFEAWLDGGRAAKGGAEAQSHVAGCARCAESLTEAQTLEALLAFPMEAPPGLVDEIMVRVREPRPVPLPYLGPVLPWWVPAARDPAVVLALVLACWVVGRYQAFWSVAASFDSWVQSIVSAGTGWSSRLASAPDPSTQLGVAIVLLLASLCLSYLSFGWAREVIARPAFLPARPRSG